MSVSITGSTDKVEANLSEYCHNPLAYGTIEGVPEFLAPRLGSWVSDGMDETELINTIRSFKPGQGPGSPSWINSLSQIGAANFEQAKQVELTGTRATAKAEYLVITQLLDEAGKLEL